MFKYLISPEKPGASHLIAITVKNNTITAYVQNKPRPFWDVTSDRGYAGFFRCIETSSLGNVTFVKRIDLDHSKYHSINDPHELQLMHSHVKHQNQIRRQNLKSFLKSLQQCEELEGYLNHALIKDILQKFKEYCYERRFKDNDNSDDYIVSNNPHYSVEIPTPLLSEHARCLLLPDKIGCDQSTPAMIAAQNQADMILKTSEYILPALLATGMLMFLLYRENQHGPKESKNNSKKLKQQPKLKAS